MGFDAKYGRVTTEHGDIPEPEVNDAPAGAEVLA